MGCKYEVYEWHYHAGLQEWRYDDIYRGQSFFRALYVMICAKRRGAGCVKLEWR